MKPGNNLMVSARGLTKRYPAGDSDRDAVHDVNLAMPASQLWVVSGPSGSGKTTLLGLIGGMIAPTRGEVILAGQSITHLRDHHRATIRRTRVGMVFQEFALVPGMTLLDNVLLPLVPQGGARAHDVNRARQWLRRFGIEPLAGAKVERLSGGEKQRGAMARALILDPPLLLLDEPTASLDTANVHQIMELLFSLRDEGRTILVATHDPRLLEDERVNGTFNLVDGILKS
jgi:putative ABC transport system ATP-binding protein